jgi:hypothetical protein
MTLVLTEVSSFGVSMAADSAVRFPSGRVYIGAQKLSPVSKIDAGLSLWGRGDVNGVDADVWLQRFIENDVRNGMSLWNMANELAEKLNEAFGGVISGRMGIHVGGFDEKNGIRGPAFYHVHNGHYRIGFVNGQVVELPEEDPPVREFRAHEDRAPAIYAESDFRITRNGDFAIFAFLYDRINPLFNRIQQIIGLSFPYPPSLAARGEYLRFWISTVIEIYRLSNARKRILPQPATAGDASIGGPVSVLTISESGIESFYTK